MEPKPKAPTQLRRQRQQKTREKGPTLSSREVRIALRKSYWKITPKRNQEIRTDKIISHNMQGGWSQAHKKLQIESWLAEESPMCAFIQEPMLADKHTEWHTVMRAPYKAYVHYGTSSGNGGLITLIHSTLAHKVIEKDIIKDKQGRYMAIPIATLEPGVKMWFCNIYGPAANKIEKQDKEQAEDSENETITKEKEKFWQEEMYKQMNNIHQAGGPKDYIVLGMDANSIMEVEMDASWEELQKTTSWRNQQIKQSRPFVKWAMEHQLWDTWRNKHRQERQYSRRPMPPQAQKRIDMILV